MKQDKKILAMQAETLQRLMEQIVILLPEETFRDIWERTNEAEQLLKSVVERNGEGQNENRFLIY